MDEAMESLLAQAEREGKWLFCHYQGLWFSPEELRKAQSEGRFRWGAVNWILRDPTEKLAVIDRGVEELERERAAVVKRIKA